MFMATTYLHYKYENTIQVSKGSILVYEKCDKTACPFFKAIEGPQGPNQRL